MIPHPNIKQATSSAGTLNLATGMKYHSSKSRTEPGRTFDRARGCRGEGPLILRYLQECSVDGN